MMRIYCVLLLFYCLFFAFSRSTRSACKSDSAPCLSSITYRLMGYPGRSFNLQSPAGPYREMADPFFLPGTTMTVQACSRDISITAANHHGLPLRRIEQCGQPLFRICRGKGLHRPRIDRSDYYSVGASSRSRKNISTPAKNTSAMRIPGSRFTSGTRSVAAT